MLSFPCRPGRVAALGTPIEALACSGHRSVIFDDTCVLCGRLPVETIRQTWADRAAKLERVRSGAPSLGRLRPVVRKAVKTPRVDQVEYEPDLPGLTPAQRAYLQAFDRFLRSRSVEDRRAMKERLEPVLADAAVRPASTRWSQAKRRKAILDALASEDLTRAELATTLPDARGLHLTLAKMLREGVIAVNETADPPTYSAVVVQALAA